MSIHTFPKVICAEMNVTEWVDFELTSLEAAANNNNNNNKWQPFLLSCPDFFFPKFNFMTDEVSIITKPVNLYR